MHIKLLAILILAKESHGFVSLLNFVILEQVFRAVSIQVSICKIKLSSLLCKFSSLGWVTHTLIEFGFVNVELEDSWGVLDSFVDKIH